MVINQHTNDRIGDTHRLSFLLDTQKRLLKNVGHSVAAFLLFFQRFTQCMPSKHCTFHTGRHVRNIL